MSRGAALATLAVLAAAPARGDERFLTEAQAPAALFGDGAVGSAGTLSLSDAELGTLSRLVGKRVELRRYPYLTVRSAQGAELGVIVFLEVVGQSLPISFAVGVKPDGTLQDLQVMVYREPYGKEIGERRFRAQFRGKGPADPLVIGKDIDAISGATISSGSAAYAARKGLAVARLLLDRGKPAPSGAP